MLTRIGCRRFSMPFTMTKAAKSGDTRQGMMALWERRLSIVTSFAINSSRL